MDLLVAFFLLTVTVTSGETVTSAPVVVYHRDIRLGDVRDLSAVPADLRDRAARLRVATLSPGAETAHLQNQLIDAEARSAMPVLGIWLNADRGQTSVHYQPPSAAVDVGEAAAPALGRARISCVRIVHAMVAGSPVRAGDLVQTACGVDAPSNKAFVYDPTTASLVAGRALNTNEIATAPPRAATPVITPGQPLMIASHVGPVVIQRAVVAVQAGWPGRNLFVRASDGMVFATHVSETEH